MGEWCPYCGKNGVEWRTPGDPRPSASGPVCWECHTMWPYDTLYKYRRKAREVGMCLQDYEKEKSMKVQGSDLGEKVEEIADHLDRVLAEGIRSAEEGRDIIFNTVGTLRSILKKEVRGRRCTNCGTWVNDRNEDWNDKVVHCLEMIVGLLRDGNPHISSLSWSDYKGRVNEIEDFITNHMGRD